MEKEEQHPPVRWHVKKEVSLADLLSFASAALAVVYAYTTLDKRVTMLESSLIEARIAAKKQDEELVRLQARIDVRLDRMDEKLERLLQQRFK